MEKKKYSILTKLFGKLHKVSNNKIYVSRQYKDYPTFEEIKTPYGYAEIVSGAGIKGEIIPTEKFKQGLIDLKNACDERLKLIP